jgi:ketosteroid isomerase-like protein
VSGSRKDVLSQALVSAVGGASPDPSTLFTDDVVGWSPISTVSGLADVAELFDQRDETFSNVTIALRGLDEVGNRAYAEWLIAAEHTGPLALGDDVVLEATGRPIVLPGVTVADFRDGKIRSFRTYFDDVLLLEQLVDA